MTLGRVCETCRGRGRVYGRFGARTCETCGGFGPRDDRSQLEVLDALASCHRRYQDDARLAANLELAIRRCFDAGLSAEQIHRRAGVPLSLVRNVGAGQGLL